MRYSTTTPSFREDLRRLGFTSYAAYLNGRHWQNVKARFRASDREQCCYCCGEWETRLHHKTYERLGAEHLDDLVPLCTRCHTLVHVLERRGDIGLDLTGLLNATRAKRYAIQQEELLGVNAVKLARTVPALIALAGCTSTQAQPHAAQPAHCHYRILQAGRLGPDPHCTPGALNPAAVSDPQATICVRGYTRKIRPPESVTRPQKLASERAYGAHGPGEFDHLVALEDGGAPDDLRNLWFEPGPIPNPKDAVENRLHGLICSGRMSVEQAARILESDWTRG